MKSPSTRIITRRQILTAAAAALPGLGLLGGVIAPCMATPRSPAGSPKPYVFFTATEASFIEAACERLIPADSFGPGAREAGVPGYLDRHLADAWGRGERLYRPGQWQPGTPSERRQTSKPAELFRSALSAIHCDLSGRGTCFAELPAAAQDSYLASLEAGHPLPGVATAAFFDLLLLLTTEGFFTHSSGARHRDRLAWPVRGFPGAHASTSPFGDRSRC
jgi:gluconate 2-dehydrogenase gamma chain